MRHQYSGAKSTIRNKFHQLIDELQNNGGSLSVIEHIVQSRNTLSDRVSVECDTKGDTVLHHAISHNSDVRIVRFLMETYPQTISTANNDRENVLLVALLCRDRRHRYFECIESQARANVDAQHQAALMMLCLAGNVQTKGKDPRHRTTADDRVTDFSGLDCDVMQIISKQLETGELSDEDLFTNLDAIIVLLAHTMASLQKSPPYWDFLIFTALSVRAAPAVIECILRVSPDTLLWNHRRPDALGMALHHALQIMESDSADNLQVLEQLCVAGPCAMVYESRHVPSPLRIALTHSQNPQIVCMLAAHPVGLVNILDRHNLTIFRNIAQSTAKCSVTHIVTLFRHASSHTLCMKSPLGLSALHMIGWNFDSHFKHYGLKFILKIATACPEAIAVLEDKFGDTVVHYILRLYYQKEGISESKHSALLQTLGVLVSSYPSVLVMKTGSQRPIDLVQNDSGQSALSHKRFRAQVAIMLLHHTLLNEHVSPT